MGHDMLKVTVEGFGKTLFLRWLEQALKEHGPTHKIPLWEVNQADHRGTQKAPGAARVEYMFIDITRK